MSGLKLLRNRINSIKTTQKITKAMRMVAASKLNKAKLSAEYCNKFKKKIVSLLNSAKTNLDENDISRLTKAIFSSNKNNKALFIVYCSDKGLCGGFNNQILKIFNKSHKEYIEKKVILVGSKLRRQINNICEIKNIYSMSSNVKELTRNIKNDISDEIEQNPNLDVISIYSHFVNPITQTPYSKSLFPIETSDNEDTNLNIEFEGKQIINKLTDLYIDSNIIANYYQSKASEEASRMNAMDSATNNAEDLKDKFTLKLNRTRQTIITNELIEVISGAEAI